MTRHTSYVILSWSNRITSLKTQDANCIPRLWLKILKTLFFSPNNVNADNVRTDLATSKDKAVICPVIARGVAIQFIIAYFRRWVWLEILPMVGQTWALFDGADRSKTKLKGTKLVLTNFWHYCHQSGEQFMQLLSILVPNEWKTNRR